MNTYLECIPCFIKQSLEATRMATDDEAVHIEVIKEVLNHLQSVSFTNSPPELSREVHGIIKNITKSKDPYKTVKDTSNTLAKNQYFQLEKMIEESNDSLLMALKIAIAGNVIDFGTFNRFNVEDMLNSLVKKEIDAQSYQQFKKTLVTSKTILYLADNAGEIFFDKILIKELLKQNKIITYAVRANPIINDATIDDVRVAGIDKLATIIESDAGQKQSAPGVLIKLSSKKFLDYFKSSDMILSKGQGNYEGLSSINRDIFFLLVVKCILVSRDIGDDVGKLILKVKK
jgi:damage-control phosphatase, subfamily I